MFQKMVVKLIGTNKVIKSNKVLEQCVECCNSAGVYPFNDDKFNEVLKKAEIGELKGFEKQLIKEIANVRDGASNFNYKGDGDLIKKAENYSKLLIDLPNLLHVKVGGGTAGRMVYALIKSKDVISILLGQDTNDIINLSISEVGLIIGAWDNHTEYARDLKVKDN